MLDDLRLARRHLRGDFDGQHRCGLPAAVLAIAATGAGTIVLAAIAVFLALEPLR